MYINVDAHTHRNTRIHWYLDELASLSSSSSSTLVAATKSEIVDQKCEKGRQMQETKNKNCHKRENHSTHRHTHSHWIFHNIRNNSHYARPAFLLQLKKKLITKILIASAVNIVRKSQVTPQTLGNLSQQPSARPFFIVIWKYTWLLSWKTWPINNCIHICIEVFESKAKPVRSGSLDSIDSLLAYIYR